jgi:hypothetical protein
MKRPSLRRVAASTPSLTQNARQRGSFLCRRITTNPSLAQIVRQRGYLSTHPLQPPRSLKMQDRGVFPLSTPSTLHPCSKRETEGVPLSTHHHQPLPHSNCETEGFSVNNPPPPPSLTRNARRRGCFLCRSTPPLPHSKLYIICTQCIFLVLCHTGCFDHHIWPIQLGIKFLCSHLCLCPKLQ